MFPKLIFVNFFFKLRLLATFFLEHCFRLGVTATPFRGGQCPGFEGHGVRIEAIQPMNFFDGLSDLTKVSNTQLHFWVMTKQSCRLMHKMELGNLAGLQLH